MLGKLFDGNLLGAHRNPVLYIVLPDDVFSRRVCWIRLDVGVLGCAGNAWAMVSARSSLHSAAAVVGMYRMTQLYSRMHARTRTRAHARTPTPCPLPPSSHISSVCMSSLSPSGGIDPGFAPPDICDIIEFMASKSVPASSFVTFPSLFLSIMSNI